MATQGSGLARGQKKSSYQFLYSHKKGTRKRPLKDAEKKKNAEMKPLSVQIGK